MKLSELTIGDLITLEYSGKPRIGIATSFGPDSKGLVELDAVSPESREFVRAETSDGPRTFVQGDKMANLRRYAK
jgi:hypothetical protein